MCGLNRAAALYRHPTVTGKKSIVQDINLSTYSGLDRPLNWGHKTPCVGYSWKHDWLRREKRRRDGEKKNHRARMSNIRFNVKRLMGFKGVFFISFCLHDQPLALRHLNSWPDFFRKLKGFSLYSRTETPRVILPPLVFISLNPTFGFLSLTGGNRVYRKSSKCPHGLSCRLIKTPHVWLIDPDGDR